LQNLHRPWLASEKLSSLGKLDSHVMVGENSALYYL